MHNAILECGVIKRRDSSIDRKEWDKLIESHPALEQVPDQTGTNPFTGEKKLFSGDCVGRYVVGGKKQGSLTYFDGKLSITNLPESFCNEIAALLKAEVLPGMDAYTEK